MTNFDTNPIDALEGLLEERRRYEGWLAQLEGRRATSPSHVVDRVRSDYLGRLEAVTQQLRGRASDLEASATGLRERIHALLSEEGVRRDERAELELRALVGEFEPDRAQQSMAACDQAIGTLAAERGGYEHELGRITEVLALVAAPAHPATLAEPAPEPASPPRDAEASAPKQDAVSPSALETASLAAPEPSPMDELAFLQSVVDAPRESQAAAPQNAEPQTAAPQTAAPAPAAEPELPAVPRAEGGADLLPPPVLTAPRRPTPLSTNLPPVRDPFAGSAKASTLTPGSIPSFLKDMPTEQVKTLKCQECGTMNYPTEWYCERCGGELAAM